MKRLRQKLPAAALAVFWIMGCTVPTAGAESGADYTVGISQKLGRGAVNLISSPLELPCAIRDEVQEQGAAGGVTGLFKGIALFLRRALVGVTEIGTFVIPMEATLPSVCAKRPAPAVQAY